MGGWIWELVNMYFEEEIVSIALKEAVMLLFAWPSLDSAILDNY